MKKLGSWSFWLTVIAILSFAWIRSLRYVGPTPVLDLPRWALRALFFEVRVPVFPVTCVLVVRYCLGLVEEKMGHLKLTFSRPESSASS